MSSKIRKPVMKGVAKVPVIMQLEMLECGAASLAMILAYYNKWVPLEQVRLDCGVSRDGSNARKMLQAARNYGLEAKALKLEPEDLMEEGPYPCIIHWGFNHFVVLDGFKGRKAIINDPAKGKIEVPWDEFDKEFTGICMTFEPTDEFQPAGRKKSVWDYAKISLAGSGIAVAFVVLTTSISSLMGVIQPVFSRIFLDRLLTGSNPGWFYPFIAAFVVFACILVFTGWITAIYSMRIQGKMATLGEAGYMWKVLHLPMHFFSQRMAGDIAERQDDSAAIAASLVNTFGPLLINTVMMIFYLVVMVRYSLILTVVGVGAIVINIIVSLVMSKKRINITRIELRDRGKLSGITVSGINMIETIKSSGAEKGFFAKWSGYQASVNTQNVRISNVENFLGMVPAIVSSLADLAVMGIGIYLVLAGQFTPGMVMAFQGFLTSFMTPAASLVTAGQTFQEMITKMERVDDVMSYPEDECFGAKLDDKELQKLRGNIEIENITFGYSRMDKPLIENFSMSIKQGQKVAFVGRSGCGKSTLAMLISGLYKPWSGSIKFDGKTATEIDRSVFTGSVSVVEQDVTLFEDTILDNLKMWDHSIEDFEIVMAARDAAIHDDIMLTDGDYHHKLLEGGRDMSGGQRQRLEIARALAQDPTICVLDEATSALDAKTEFDVVNAISARGITCVIIAHRLSTIRDCDEIVVLDHGKVVERGTHNELYAMGGVYAELVTRE